MCQSIGDYKRALHIAKQGTDSKKIKECLQVLYTREEAIIEAKRIL